VREPGRAAEPPYGTGRFGRVARAAAGLLTVYKRYLSPVLPRACRFHPTCSEYAREALLRHGLTRGAGLAFRRLCRCHPFHEGGIDPVP
jgi:putative membrane protein insertion efficiency factor